MLNINIMTKGVLVRKFLFEKLNHKQNKNLTLSKAFRDNKSGQINKIKSNI